MVEDIFLEIAVFTFLMVMIGIGLTIYEFKKMMKDHNAIKKEKGVNNQK